MAASSRSFLGFAVVASVLAASSASSSAPDCAEYPICQFDGDQQQGTCRDYGYINEDDGTKTLIPWHIGSDGCMAEFNIQISSLDPTSSCSSANGFVNSLRFGDLASSTAKLGLGVGAMPPDGFFEQANSYSTIALKDSITIDGTSYDCAVSESGCYNAMKPYFESDPSGEKEMEDVCSKLEGQVKVDAQLEQSTLRNAMCQQISSASSTTQALCEPLWGQLEQIILQHPSKECSGYSFGIGNTALPPCDGSAADSSTPITRSNGGEIQLIPSLTTSFLRSR
ncbi:hypothetical protein ACHAXR_007444 [Thalassiosira sp. AJA248-18]